MTEKRPKFFPTNHFFLKENHFHLTSPPPLSPSGTNLPLNAPLPLPATHRNNRRHPARPRRPRLRQNESNHRKNPAPFRERNQTGKYLSPHLLRQSRRGDAGKIREENKHRRAHGEHLPRVRALDAGGQRAGLGDQLLVGVKDSGKLWGSPRGEGRQPR